jgi:hypothetical protein
MGGDVFCASNFPEDGCYCYPKHVGAGTVHVLTNSCKKVGRIHTVVLAIKIKYLLELCII